MWLVASPHINVFWLALCQTDAWDKSLRVFPLMSYVSGHFFLNNFRFQWSVVFLSQFHCISWIYHFDKNCQFLSQYSSTFTSIWQVLKWLWLHPQPQLFGFLWESWGTSGWPHNRVESKLDFGPSGLWGSELLPKVISLSKHQSNLMCDSNDNGVLARGQPVRPLLVVQET